MLEVVAYDIASPKRLRHVAKVCEDYGVRIEKSVFECRLDPKQFQKLWNALCAITHPDEDLVAAYPLCSMCAKGIQTNVPWVRPVLPQVYIF